MRKLENHPSVQDIKQNISVHQELYLCHIEFRDILKGATALNRKTNGTVGSIPTNPLKEVSNILALPLNDIFNKEIIT